jgi:hypothetical protein
VNTVGGRRQARNIQAGCRLWALEGERTVQTAVREAAWSQDKPFTLYSYRLDPHPGFLVNGHLARQPW